MNPLAIKELLYKMADDRLILGHRNSEWTGFGPLLEEDISFSSMAQDKIGQAQALFQLLNQMGEQDPDTVAFTRNAPQMHCCHLVEYPIGEYDFSIVRHFLFDHADLLRMESLATSPFEPLAQVARKCKSELKYHVFHANTLMEKLATGTEESHKRIQDSLNTCWNLALGIFEPSPFENDIVEMKITEGEEALKEKWLAQVTTLLTKYGLSIPSQDQWAPAYGGRVGKHTEYLQPLLDEMCEVFKIDPNAEW